MSCRTQWRVGVHRTRRGASPLTAGMGSLDSLWALRDEQNVCARCPLWPYAVELRLVSRCMSPFPQSASDDLKSCGVQVAFLSDLALS